MRKLIVALMVGSLILTGIGLATAADSPQAQQGVDLPQALQGVDLNQAQVVTAKEAQEVRGAACIGPSYDFLNGAGLYPKDYLGTKN